MNTGPTSTSRTHRRLLLGGLVALLFGVTAAGTMFVASAAGIGGHDDPLATLDPQQTITTTFPPIETPVAQPTAAGTTTTDPNRVDPVLGAATNAALRYFNATSDPSICKQDPPRKQTCLSHSVSEPDSPDRGVAAFSLADAEGGGALVVFARDEAGGWQFWFGTQQGVYHALKMPAAMRVCADGQGANVRQSPSLAAKSLGVLKDNSIVTAQQFLLTDPGYLQPNAGHNGNGWYQVTGAINGFVRADLLSVTTMPDCSLRNALVKAP